MIIDANEMTRIKGSVCYYLRNAGGHGVGLLRGREIDRTGPR